MSLLYSYAALLLRVALGTMWISHGLLKLLVLTVPGFAAYLAAQGMPAWLAWPVVWLELVGGILLVLGFYGRVASLALLPVLSGATLVHLGDGWFFSTANGGWEYPAFLAVASIVHILLGDGEWALTSRPAAAGGT